MRRPASRVWTSRALVAAVVVAATFGVVKGLPLGVQSRGWPYYALTYRFGFIRRGLFGTIFQAFAAGFDRDAQKLFALGLHVFLFAALGVALVRWGLSRAHAAAEGSQRRALVMAGTAALVLSPLAPTVLQLAGYLDLYILALAAAGAWLADRGSLRSAALVAAVGPFVHDAFIFLWLPVLFVEVRRAGRGALPLLAPFVSELVVLVLSSNTAVMHAIDAIPDADFLKGTFELTTGKLLGVMIGKFVGQPLQALLAIAVILPAALLIGVAAYTLDPAKTRWKRALFVVVASAAPSGVLLVAWDLSRFLTWAIFGAFLVLLGNAREPREEEPARSPKVLRASLAVLAFLAYGPHLYLYFEEGYGDYGFAPEFVRHLPPAKLELAFLTFYNRNRALSSYALSQPPCDVEVHDADQSGSCAFALRPGGVVEKRFLWLRPGAYRASVTADATCDGELEVVVPWRFGSPRPAARIEGGHAELRFTMTNEEASLARAFVKVKSAGGCAALRELRVDPE